MIRRLFPFAAGGLAGLTLAGRTWTILVALFVVFACGFLLGCLTRRLWAIGAGLERRLSDDDLHPCAQCLKPIGGRNKYCGHACREAAADERAQRRILMERLADYGEVPF